MSYIKKNIQNNKNYFCFIYIRILGIYMNNKTDSQSEYNDIITLKVTDDFKDMLDYLQEQTLLNRSSVIRYAVVEFYKTNKGDLHKYD